MAGGQEVLGVTVLVMEVRVEVVVVVVVMGVGCVRGVWFEGLCALCAVLLPLCAVLRATPGVTAALCSSPIRPTVRDDV